MAWVDKFTGLRKNTPLLIFSTFLVLMRLLESGQLLSIGANDGHCRSWKEANLPQDVDKLPHSSAPPNKLLTSIASFDKCWKTIGIPSNNGSLPKSLSANYQAQ